MLLGGMKVVGIYVWASDGAFKNSTMALCQVHFVGISFSKYNVHKFELWNAFVKK